MAWLLLALAGALEIVWSAAMKYSDGFTKPLATGVAMFGGFVGFWLLAQAMRGLPLGTAYSVWVGIGAVGAFGVGAIWFSEPVTALRLGSVALILCGIIGLKLAERGVVT